MKIKSSTVKIICIILVPVLLCGFLGWLTGGFQNFDSESVGDKFAPEVNDKNLYTAECMTLKDRNAGDGIVVTVNDDGSFKVKGTASEDITFEIGEVTLNEGTYTLTALKGASKASAYVKCVSDAGLDVYADFTGNTFTVNTDNTVVTLGFAISEGTEINATVYPVIVAGEEAGDFYK